ncbi:MAG: hypothetical protein AABY07_00220 [Nanoarchaeota archaeon]
MKLNKPSEINKNCVICNRIYSTNSIKSMYCKECKIIVRNKKAMERYYKNHEENLRKNREYNKIPRVHARKKRSDKKYYLKNSEKLKLKSEEWYNKNKERAIKKSKEWVENNRKKRNQIGRDYDKRNPEKTRAHGLVYYHKMRGKKCEECGSLEHLEFHHTDYENNKGLTLCRDCHYKVHRKKKDEN